MKYITTIICATIIWGALLGAQVNKQHSIERQVNAKIQFEQNKLDAEYKKEEQLEDCLATAKTAYYKYAELNWSIDEDWIITADVEDWNNAEHMQVRDNAICFKRYK